MDAIDVRHLPGSEVVDVIRGQGYFPVIAALGKEELLIVLRGGAGHIGIEGRLDVVRSTDSGKTWGAPQTVADSERDDRNPALGVTKDDTIVLAYHWQGSYDAEGNWDRSVRKTDTRVVRSTDGGRTWGEDTLINDTPINGASPFGKIRKIDGVLHMPIYGGEKVVGDSDRVVRVGPSTCPTYLLRSTDGGRTWRDPTLVALGLNEGDFLVLPDGTWLFTARAEQRDDQSIHTCRSTDGGWTWTYGARVTAHGEHPPDLTLLSNGWILLTFGHRLFPFGVQGLISRDGGCTWSEQRLLFEDACHGGDSGYPSTVRLLSGRLVTVFYSAGTPEKPQYGLSDAGALCRAICYDEAALISAAS